MPVEIEVHTVPHFKAPVNCKKECYYNSIVKLGRLVHKTDFGKTAVVCTVAGHRLGGNTILNTYVPR